MQIDSVSLRAQAGKGKKFLRRSFESESFFDKTERHSSCKNSNFMFSNKSMTLFAFVHTASHAATLCFYLPASATPSKRESECVCGWEIKFYKTDFDEL